MISRTLFFDKIRCELHNSLSHKLTINRPTKRGKEKFPSDGHCQCQKEMDDHLLACQQFLTESHIVTLLANERASFLNINDINDILFFRNVSTAIIVVKLYPWTKGASMFLSIYGTHTIVNHGYTSKSEGIFSHII
jgi:hypothetical protein